MVEVYAFYFPQLYVTQENSDWWGEGFTDWKLVKEAGPIFEGHNQPRIPLMGYQDQSDPKVIEQQVKLANKYGISGFNFYHYWFDSKPYLDVPIKNLLENKKLDTKFILTWANESWTRQWIGKPNDYLLEQNYYSSDLEIEEHYRYLLQFFLDDRYRKVDNRPIMAIYRPELIPELSSVLAKFNELAISDGFDGIYFMACRSYPLPNAKSVYSGFEGIINFNPRYTVNRCLRKSGVIGFDKYLRALPERLQSRLAGVRSLLKRHTKHSYRELLASLKLLESFEGDIPVYQSVFPDWDNTARYGKSATLFSDVTPGAFREMVDVSISQLTSDHINFLFVNAWNEWSESAYLEPDKKQNFTSLDILHEAISIKR